MDGNCAGAWLRFPFSACQLLNPGTGLSHHNQHSSFSSQTVRQRMEKLPEGQALLPLSASSSLKSLFPRRSSALLTRCFHPSKVSQAAGVSHMNSPVLSSRSERLKPKLLDTGLSFGCSLSFSLSLSHWSQCLPPLSHTHDNSIFS